MLFLYFHFFQLFNYWLVSTLVIFYIHTAHSYIRGWFYNIRYLNKQNFLHREGRKKRSSRMELNEFESEAREGGKKKNPRNLHKIWSKFREQPEEWWWWWWGGERNKKKMRMEKMLKQLLMRMMSRFCCCSFWLLVLRL